MKKRVLQLIGSFHQGGSERQAVQLTQRLIADGRFDVRVATLDRNGPLLDTLIGVGMSDIPEYPLNSFYDANFVRQVRSFAAYLRDQRIDIIHTHDFYTNVFGMAAATLARTPGRIASKRETGGMRSRAQMFVERIAFGRANAIVVNCNAVRDHLIAAAIPGEKARVIYNGVDIAHYSSEDVLESRSLIRERYALPINDAARLITLVANLRHEVKNVPMLLRAASRVVREIPDVHFVIAGEGELEAGLRAMSVELAANERVHFVGRCSDVAELLQSSYACVLTSFNEGFSNAIIEYMAAGRPVVATNVGGASEAIVEGETGYLIRSDDDAALAERLIDLLNDHGLAERSGEAGRKRARELFSLDAQADKTLDLYGEVLEAVNEK